VSPGVLWLVVRGRVLSGSAVSAPTCLLHGGMVCWYGRLVAAELGVFLSHLDLAHPPLWVWSVASVVKR
ncbi:hypothetical protein A2U01_0110869, partial [Trifolium medium]|nr:hypothetical protein [Trifolium medium]